MYVSIPSNVQLVFFLMQFNFQFEFLKDIKLLDLNAIEFD
jgi:hypothetical protein